MNKINIAMLRDAAKLVRLHVQNVGSGYRILREEENSNAVVFPLSALGTYASKQACLGFLFGVLYGRSHK